MKTPVSELRPDLHLVPTDRIRFHEHPERGRSLRLKARLESEGFLRNPPIVAAMGGGDYLLLDGANRVSAFAEMRHSHVPAQVVDYHDSAIELKGWHHLLIDSQDLELRAIYAERLALDVRPVDPGELARILEDRQVVAVLVEGDNSCWGLFAQEADELPVDRRIELLDAVVDAYEGQARLERIKLADYSQLPSIIEEISHQLVLFPVLRKEELLDLAGRGIRIPTGLTRHLIPGRALALNLELAFLTELRTEEDKRRHLREYVARLVVDGRIRYYEESVFIMNE